jgi:cytosine/adenosine deaminase-related metal-dependent hydrolase
MSDLRRTVLARHSDAERINGSKKAVLPGLANLHTHFELTLARGIYEDLLPPHTPPFSGGMAELPLPVLSADQRRVMCCLGALEAIRSGTTADCRIPRPEDVLRWATVNGYRALGLPGGSIAIGNPADLIMVDLQQAHLVPLMRPVSSFVHQGRASDVVAVMVDGHWLMRDGEVLSMDEAAIVDEADRIARQAWSELFAAQRGLPMPLGFDDRMPSRG